MKTSKFKYRVFFGNSSEYIDCITLAEARLSASRFPYARIQCLGEIIYENGIEKDKKNT